MIARTIALALLCAWTQAISPVGDTNECALYLTGPGRTSAYDYSINLLKGNFGYEGQSNCITYEAINQAYLEARNRILVSQPKGDWKAEDFASVGELILDISTNIARRYGLTYEEIEKGLPLIDTSRTLIREVCPPVFSHVECRAGKYRRLDGLCNNLQHPTWGATMAPFQRLLGPLFSDGINAPRIAHHGRDLPLSRVVSRTMHPDEGFHDHAGTVMVIAWGQFMDHDYTLTGTPLDPKSRNDPEECCNRPPHLKHPYCNEIRIPDDDYFYRLFGVKCIDFVRGFPSPRPGCRLGSRVPFNTLTGSIDGNTVYGVTEKFARKLRTGFGGLLRMNPIFKEYGLKDLLPLKLDIPEEGCTRPNDNMYCFEAGEIRVNEQLVLTVMHTLMAREHNRVANALAEVNPHWDDETLYQEARRINIAEIQHITYNEFLPILLGKDVMEKFGLVLEKKGYWDGYDTEVNPDVIDAFAAAAYRFGHSLLPTAVERWSKAHKFIASKRLSDLIRRPFDLYRAGVLDEYVMGLMNQVAQAMDDSITQEVTNHLFKKVGSRFGMDLVSFNMQRGREFGLPGYMEFRKFCGLPHADTFQDLFGSMPNKTVLKYETIFDHPIDVDLWSGGVSERPLPGSMLGPTFACIIATQFSYSRRGDRFWFELPNQPSSFTPEQLTEIRKSRLARVICDNTDIIDTVQLYPMVLPDHELNPRVPCRSGILPQMDFSKWAEPAPFHGPAKQFMTNATVIENNNMKHEELSSDVQNCNSKKVCNQTEVSKQIKQLQATNNTENIITNITGTGNNSTKENQSVSIIANQNTLLKYVYKNNDKVELYTKDKGHIKNRLKRRKRSTEDPLSPLPSKYQKPALIVNYETSHGPTATASWSPPINSANAIEDDVRADFKIVTRHYNTDDKNEKETDKQSNLDSNEAAKLNENSNESTESLENVKKENTSRESDESSEQHDYKNDKKESVYDHNHADNYKDGSRKNGNNDVSNESIENRIIKSDSESVENNESGERSDTNNYASSEQPLDKRSESSSFNQSPYSPEHSEDRERKNEDYNSYNPSKEESSENSNERYDHTSTPHNSKPLHDKDKKKGNSKRISPESLNVNSREHDRYSESYTHHHKNNQENSKPSHSGDNQESSIENSSETNVKETNYSKNKIDLKSDVPNPVHNKPALPIQDIDLGDFSYEKININQDGNVVAVEDSSKENNANSAIQKISPNIDTKTPNTFQLVKNNLLANYSDKLVKINDGEIKPVVEINSEDNDDSSEKIEKSSFNNFDSLEADLNNKDGGSSKILNAHKEIEGGDVKQQFERIPLNYNHNQKVKTDDDTNAPKDEYSSSSQDLPNEEDAVLKSEGTIDVFAPNDEKYDENLNLKFSDLHIKLPEIVLPDDILSFTKSHSPFKDENNGDKNERYHYPRYTERRSKSKKKQDDDSENEEEDGPISDYYGYYNDKGKKQDYRKKADEEEQSDEEEDLYEKFVRERFGKRGTFEKRSEKLVEPPLNPDLRKTIQKILKKTASLDEPVKGSGDPNAKYMWTLEYGETL
ncbi:unnamed protein product [Arctia plantaginis]|uniref:Chorion peroxidase n=1 Tax=Arctia plantaginis TaxID=874455 RepID=A0A8S1AVY0_ARCPL|nr:unnamed protein product [Arctia plantaginis]